MHPLPRLLVELIDALDRKEAVEALRSSWTTLAHELEEMLAEWHLSYLDVEDRALVEALPERLSALCQAATLDDSEGLLEAALQFFPAFDSAKFERERAHLTPDKPIDNCVLACGSAAVGLGTREGVKRTLASARLSLQRLTDLFRPSASSFPVEYGMRLESGFHSLDKAIRRLESWVELATPSTESLRQALMEFQDGLTKLNPFLQALEETRGEVDFAIPVLGDYLYALKGAKDDAPLKDLRTEGLEAYRSMWFKTTDYWLLPASKVGEVLGKVEAEFQVFVSALEAFERDADSFWAATDRLDQAFRALRAQSMPVDVVLQSFLGPEASLVLGLLNGGVPELAAKNAIVGIRAGDVPPGLLRLAQQLEDYLHHRDKMVLLQALEALIAEVS